MAATMTRRGVRDRVISIVPSDRPITVAEAASRSGVSISTARRALFQGADNLELEYYEREHRKKGIKLLYFRRFVEGETRPLYQPQPGIDARPLAQCLGGYTFTGDEHGIRQ